MENVHLDRHSKAIEESYKKWITQLERTEESPIRTRGNASPDTKQAATARTTLKQVQQSLGSSPTWLMSWFESEGQDSSGFSARDMWLLTFPTGRRSCEESGSRTSHDDGFQE